MKKLLEEVDADIREILLADAEKLRDYKNWELLNSPALTAIEWQRMRNENRKK